MKFKELELSSSEKVQVYCDILVSSTIGSTCPKVALWSAYGNMSELLELDKYNFLSEAEVKGVTDFVIDKCVELKISVDEEFYDRYINEEV
nr:MAG: hypothetical protein [Bacteriophage sp.]